MKKPRECCDIGSYEHTVPMAIKGRRQDVDFCVSDIIAALNAANITTVASCCGHGKLLGNIILEDGRMITVSEIRLNEEGCVVPLIQPDLEKIVDRFLEWRLPEDFSPDDGISFIPTSTEMPTGTNLFDAAQARNMVEYIIGIKE